MQPINSWKKWKETVRQEVIIEYDTLGHDGRVQLTIDPVVDAVKDHRMSIQDARETMRHIVREFNRCAPRKFKLFLAYSPENKTYAEHLFERLCIWGTTLVESKVIVGYSWRDISYCCSETFTTSCSKLYSTRMEAFENAYNTEYKRHLGSNSFMDKPIKEEAHLRRYTYECHVVFAPKAKHVIEIFPVYK